MTVLDSETIATVRESLVEVLASDPTKVAEALVDLGWSDIVETDSPTATRLLFEEQGRALAATRLLDTVVLGALDLPVESTEVAYDGITLGPVSAGSVLLLSEGSAATVAADVLAGRVQDATGFDRGGAWHRIDISQIPTVPLEIPPSQIVRAVAAARCAIAAELIGVSEAALALSVAHTSLRKQYGRPLASFQAVRHALAEAYAAIEHARVLAEAALAAADDASPDEVVADLARLAKHRAGAAQAVVMRHAVQVHGAMGLTLESDVHRYVTRAGALDLLLGSHVDLARSLGTALLEGGEARPLIKV